MTQGPELPWSPIAEKAILGAILIDNTCADVAWAKIEPSDFHLDSHQRIAAITKELLGNDRAVDIVTVGGLATERRELKFVGGYEYISSLLDGVPPKINIKEYVDEVLELSARRKAILMCQEVVASMMGPKPDTNQLIGQASTDLRGILDLTAQEGFRHIGGNIEALKERHATIQEKQIGDGVQIPGALSSIRNIMTQFDREDVHVIAGRPGSGKTALAMSLIIPQAKDGYRVGFVSIEMSEYQIKTRMVSQLTGVPYKTIHEGGGYFGIEDDLREGYSQMAGLPVWVDASPSIKISTCVARCEALVRKCSVDIIYIDYLQLFGLDDELMRLNRNLQIAAFVAQLKALAKRADIPVVVLVQLNRDVVKRADAHGDVVYFQSDLGEGGATEQTAATIMFIHKRPDHTAYVQVDKQRNGIAGSDVRALLKLVAPTMRYTIDLGTTNYGGKDGE